MRWITTARREVLGALLLCAACGKPVEPEAPVDLGPTGLLALPESGLQLASEPYELASGKERTRCYYVNLNNEEPLDVVRFETNQRVGQHHFNIFASDLEFEDGWQRCPNNEELFVGARPIVDGSASGVDYAFPPGMAYRLKKQSLLIFQLHSINISEGPLTQQFVLNLHVAEEPARTLVDIYGFTNFGIEIPPNSEKTETKDCTIYDSIGLISMSSHFHERGKRATAEILRQDESDAQLLYENTKWDDPDVKVFEDPIRISEGDTIRFSCHYRNDDDVEVRYGPSARDEMCFVFGYYFPKVGLIPCF